MKPCATAVLANLQLLRDAQEWIRQSIYALDPLRNEPSVEFALQRLRMSVSLLETILTTQPVIPEGGVPENFDHDPRFDEGGEYYKEANKEWSGSLDPSDPDNYWIDDETGERVNAITGERTPAKEAEPGKEANP